MQVKNIYREHNAHILPLCKNQWDRMLIWSIHMSCRIDAILSSVRFEKITRFENVSNQNICEMCWNQFLMISTDSVSRTEELFCRRKVTFSKRKEGDAFSLQQVQLRKRHGGNQTLQLQPEALWGDSAVILRLMGWKSICETAQAQSRSLQTHGKSSHVGVLQFYENCAMIDITMCRR